MGLEWVGRLDRAKMWVGLGDLRPAEELRGGTGGLPQMGLAQLERKLFFLFLFFSEFISSAKTIPAKLEIV
jgi:hypothetical protein